MKHIDIIETIQHYQNEMIWWSWMTIIFFCRKFQNFAFFIPIQNKFWSSGISHRTDIPVPLCSISEFVVYPLRRGPIVDLNLLPMKSIPNSHWLQTGGGLGPGNLYWCNSLLTWIEAASFTFMLSVIIKDSSTVPAWQRGGREENSERPVMRWLNKKNDNMQ